MRKISMLLGLIAEIFATIAILHGEIVLYFVAKMIALPSLVIGVGYYVQEVSRKIDNIRFPDRLDFSSEIELYIDTEKLAEVLAEKLKSKKRGK